ncbi:hypothetical protein [Chryseobacterium sp. Leaf180]|uniref:hypothetical protein n=1 Tax=Chryseobacterium sp. Leaf180 TaxID=1736289 RepID=UPI000B26DE1E|nr:hypothetical protein [Chryseobacterium sp. Leaf180]
MSVDPERPALRQFECFPQQSEGKCIENFIKTNDFSLQKLPDTLHFVPYPK